MLRESAFSGLFPNLFFLVLAGLITQHRAQLLLCFVKCVQCISGIQHFSMLNFLYIIICVSQVNQNMGGKGMGDENELWWPPNLLRQGGLFPILQSRLHWIQQKLSCLTGALINSPDHTIKNARDLS